MFERAPKSKLEILKTCDFEEIDHDLSSLSADERKIVFDRLATEGDEVWASETLEIDQPFSGDEQEVLVSMIEDPNLAFEVLTLDETRGKKLTREQAKTLMERIESDEGVVYLFYLNLVESGVAEEPNETETWWLERLEKVLVQTEDPGVAAYVLEHIASLTPEDRTRLEETARSEK
ncbi:MAG TPA: hypothetical protein VJH94_04795 [Candidatus Paceibacterota bacterium]